MIFSPIIHQFGIIPMIMKNQNPMKSLFLMCAYGANWMMLSPNLLLLPPFTESPGLKFTITGLKEPIAYFLIYMVTKSYRNKNQQIYWPVFRKERIDAKIQDWWETHSNDMRVFPAILLYEGLVQKPVEEWYWYRRSSICTAFISDLMPRKRFPVNNEIFAF